MMKAKAVPRPLAEKLQELARRSPKTFHAYEVLIDHTLTQLGPEPAPDPITTTVSSASFKTATPRPGERAKPFDPRAGVKRDKPGSA